MSIPRSGLLLLVFILSLLCWVVWYLPASVLVARLPAMQLAGAPLLLDQSNGRAWAGQASWHWRRHEGSLDWTLRWHGLTPGVDVVIKGAGLDVAGWLSADSQRLELSQLRLELPLAVVLDGQQNVAADGEVSGRIESLLWQDGRIDALAGRLHYGGGNGRWQQQSAVLPVMNARLFMDGSQPKVQLTDSKQQQLASASVDAKQQLQLKVYRAFAVAVGMSEGKGASTDVILTLSQPLAALTR